MYNPFLQFFDHLRYREAVKTADNEHAKTGKRFYVTPSTDRKLLVMDRKNFRRLKLKRYINHQAVIRDLVSESFYFTPYCNGSGYLDAKGRKIKLQLYFSYCQAERKREAAQRKENRKAAIKALKAKIKAFFGVL